MLVAIAEHIFGHFSKTELKKFLNLGGIFALIIGVYWTLQPLKDSLFMCTVGKEYLAWAQLVSMALLVPSIMLYSWVVDRVSRHTMLYMLVCLYAIGALVFGVLFGHEHIGIANQQTDPLRIIGWLWYFFVESYGPFMVALFWAFTTDITNPDSAKRGFSLIIMIGQLGSILGPLLVTPLAGEWCWGSSVPLVFVCAGLILLLIPYIRWFVNTTPAQEMAGYAVKHEPRPQQGFLQGLRLIRTQPYLLGIVMVTILQGSIVTIIDYQFKYLVGHTFLDNVSRTMYLGNYAVWVNTCTLLCLFLGISNIQRRLGIRTALMLMPLVIAIAVCLVYIAPYVTVLFWVMVVSRAMNYSMNAPAVRQLYVPTSHDVKYKSQAWVETFGSRGSQAVGSGMILVGRAMQAVIPPTFVGLLGGVGSVGMIGLWLCIAYAISGAYDRAVAREKLVC
jgi:AAA family ATP:ADP antiporter